MVDFQKGDIVSLSTKWSKIHPHSKKVLIHWRVTKVEGDIVHVADDTKHGKERYRSFHRSFLDLVRKGV